jgi:methionyl-tRNA synthetase
MADKAFYITTTLPYVNSEPHVGFAMEIVRADIIARSKKLQGYDVFFNTGTDEHGQKLADSAQKAGVDVKAYVDEYATKFRELIPLLGISEDIHFVRTTDSHHEAAAQEFWNRVLKNGHIYKKNYSAKYCVGCEENKTESDLVDGHCPIHPNLEIEIINEENYFFKFSEFGDRLLALYDSIEKEGRSFVVPGFRLNEMREFVKRGLEDFSISRLRSKMSWGIAVPNDPDHVMYVWFDALVNYISTLGWPEDTHQFERFWKGKDGTPVQYCGKDNTRFQAVMWQAMLMAADLPPSHTIVVNGFITSGGQKMSKSLGNVISPVDIVREYGTDAFRYFVARELQPFEDSDFTLERFKEAYNAKLANGIGNLVSRIMKMATSNDIKLKEEPIRFWSDDDDRKNLKKL